MKGSACAGNPVCGTLTATRLKPGGWRVADMAQIEVEGLVASVSGSGFGRAAFFAALEVGARLNARGNLSGGAVAWNEIQFEDQFGRSMSSPRRWRAFAEKRGVSCCAVALTPTLSRKRERE